MLRAGDIELVLSAEVISDPGDVRPGLTGDIACGGALQSLAPEKGDAGIDEALPCHALIQRMGASASHGFDIINQSIDIQSNADR